ncbi:hypothetical protein KOW79_000891 [Hemibagrus wyckioides]|uniref:Uncharacterized protein n=1 Tax=Hemibagrus wyckioides TaxID=337641 RepID=A0A9D3SZ25_9TELE|nr:hypothetical protein KOW79_000891 [Hemibagrus wyckioides]
MSVTVWELRSQCASRTLLLLFLREIGQEDEGRTERQGRRGLCRKKRSSGNEEKGKSFRFSCVCTMSDLSQGCQIFQDSLLRCVLLWLIHKEAMQIDDVAALRELNLITVSETETVPGNKESGFEHQEKQHKLL